MDVWLQKFTPRGPKSIWSRINTEKGERLITSGEMKAAELKAIELAKQDGRWDAAYASQKNISLPEGFQAALKKNKKAKAFFGTLNSVNQYTILFRIHNVKEPETRARKIQQFMKMLERGENPFVAINNFTYTFHLTQNSLNKIIKPMTNISDSELHEIVQQVVDQALGLSIKEPVSTAPAPQPVTSNKKVVAIGADHGGYELKEALKPELKTLGFEVSDMGTNSKDAVDYPDFAHAVAQAVSTGKAWRGIMIDGAGIGSCIVANKVPGVRAGMAYDYSSAVNSREHNDTNVLTLGAGLIGVNLAKQIVKTWLTTEFGGGRHQPRVDKIKSVEKKYLK